MGTLRVELSDTPLRAEYERAARRLLARGDDPPERRDSDVLPQSHSPAALELCARNWTRRMKQEHDSAATFAAMLPQLVEAEAGVDAKVAVLRSAMDELRHAALCAEVVQYLGGDPAIETDLTVPPLAEHPGVPALEKITRNLLFVGCLSETVAVALLTNEREYVRDPYIARVLKQLAGDETLHARVGWIWLRDVWGRFDAAAKERTQAYLAVALAYYEQCMIRATPYASIPDDILDEARGLGFADCRENRELFYETMDAVVLPQLDGIGLDATGAWKARACSDADGAVGATTLLG